MVLIKCWKKVENVGKCWDFSFEMLEKCWMTFKNVEEKICNFLSDREKFSDFFT
jgi:hypothetical protein